MALNDDPNALSDEEYEALFDEADAVAEPCVASVPPHELEAALARLEESNG